jgi:hypothetical protein
MEISSKDAWEKTKTSLAFQAEAKDVFGQIEIAASKGQHVVKTFALTASMEKHLLELGFKVLNNKSYSVINWSPF